MKLTNHKNLEDEVKLKEEGLKSEEKLFFFFLVSFLTS